MVIQQNFKTLTEWKFIREDSVNANSLDCDDSHWQIIQIPHTWNNLDAQQGGGRYLSRNRNAGYYRGLGWYRTMYDIPESWAQYRIFIRFGAVGSVADLYINGMFVGRHLGAFSAFCFEITTFLLCGRKNLIAVKADNSWRSDLPPLWGDFPVMGGIYRDVVLILKEKVCISPCDYASSGIYITPVIQSNSTALLNVKIIVDNITGKSLNLIIKLTLFDQDYHSIMAKTAQIFLHSDSLLTYYDKLQVIQPHFWNGKEDPYLYYLRVEIVDDTHELDRVDQFFGIREIKFEKDRGLILNGSPYRLYGVNRHQDRWNKGWALTSEDEQDDIGLILELGATGVRLAHYQHSESFYLLCDQYGILVWTEIALVDLIKKNFPFRQNARTMLRELIRQNFNHPSIFCWGLGNELGFLDSEDPVPLVENLHQLAKEEDPLRYTVIAGITQAMHKRQLHQITDLIGFNTYPGWYYGESSQMGEYLVKLNTAGGNRGVCISEYGAGGSIVHHDLKLSSIEPAGKWHPEEKQAQIHEELYPQLTATSFVWGFFLWILCDFATPHRNEGDTPGRNDKGLVTYDRKMKKDAFFFYKALWNHRPIVYITSRRYTPRVGNVWDIKVYSNCETVELYLNGVNLGQMTSLRTPIFLARKVIFQQGNNIIEAKSSHSGENVSDLCEIVIEDSKLQSNY